MWGRSSEWKRHRFYKVSTRARAAYLILCLEEALKFYDKGNTEKWRWILKELWGITSTQDIEEWVKRTCDAAPDEVLRYNSYQERIERYKKIDYWCELSEKEFCLLHALYREGDPVLPVFSSLYDKVYDVITLDWGDLEEPYTPSALPAIDAAEKILIEQNIPLPQNQQAMDFLMHHHDQHYGKPFDGIQLSSIL